MRRITLLTCALGLVLAAGARAENVTNIDELPRKIISLPNGTQAEVITFNDHNWRVVDPTVLSGADARDPDVCFEAKFDMYVTPDRIRVFGVTNLLAIDEKLRKKAQTEFKRSDNVWLCGTLRPGSAGKPVQFTAVDLIKQPPDDVKFEARIRKLEADGEADRLIELGHRIEQQTKQDVIGFANFDKLTILRDKAFEIGLQLKEKSLKPGDADGHFTLGVQWRDLRRKNSKFRELLRKALQIDPDHPNASRVAQDELQMVKFERRWISKSEMDRIDDEKKAELVRQTTASAAAAEARARARAQAAADRPTLILAQYSAMAESTPANREQAIVALGNAIQKTIDPGFAEEAMDLLANIDHPAVVNALNNATTSDLPEVRRVGYDALAWRGQSDAQAVTLLGKALAAERDINALKSGLSAIKVLRPKLAASALVASLANSERAARDEIIEALKVTTQQPHATKEAWEGWWSQNQATFDQ